MISIKKAFGPWRRELPGSTSNASYISVLFVSVFLVLNGLNTFVPFAFGQTPPDPKEAEPDQYGEFSIDTEGVAADVGTEPVPAPSPTPSPEIESSAGDSSTGEAAVASSSGDGAVETPSPTPIPTPRPEDLLPLDAWVEPTPVPTPTPTATPLQVQQNQDGSEHEAGKVEKEDPEEEAAVQLQIPAEKIVLNSQQKKRLEAARKVFRARVREGRQVYLDYYNRDPRGEPEVRICSVNLNNFGEPDEIKRLISQKEAHRLRSKRRSVIASIDGANCDVVAVQGIVGKDLGSSQEVLAQLARELSEASSTVWRSYVGLSNHQNANNGILVGNPEFEMLRIRSFNETALPVEPGFRAKNFSRDPFQIDLRIPGRGESSSRTLTLLTFQFQDSLKPKGAESEKKRLQMAEGLRQVVTSIQADSPPEDPPIIVISGDFSTARTTTSARVLEGLIRLDDFAEGGPCKLDAAEKTACDPQPHHPKLLFGVLSDTLDLGEDRAKPSAKRLAVQSALNRREEIYLLTPDLHLAWKDHKTPGRYNAGSERIRNGLKDSPLVWVELNW